jgi:hypothetical protein
MAILYLLSGWSGEFWSAQMCRPGHTSGLHQRLTLPALDSGQRTALVMPTRVSTDNINVSHDTPWILDSLPALVMRTWA